MTHLFKQSMTMHVNISYACHTQMSTPNAVFLQMPSTYIWALHYPKFPLLGIISPFYYVLSMFSLCTSDINAEFQQ